MPIIACNATMAVLLRCVPLPHGDCDTPYSQIAQAAAASQRARDHRSYVRGYQNSSV